MIRYLGLLWFFFRTSLIADLEYRFNFTVRIVTDIFWYISQAAIFEVVFRQTPTVSGWTLPETRVFLGILFLSDAVWMLLFSANLDFFTEKVRKGDLDLILTKPVNSQFMVSCQRMAPAFLMNICLSLTYLIWACGAVGVGHSLPWLFVLLPCGIMITYAMRLFFSVTAVILTRADYLQYMWYQVYKLASRPDGIFPLWLRYLLYSVVPMAFVASVPAGTVLHGPRAELIAGAMAVAAVAVMASHLFWNFALRRYTSASS